MLQAFSAVIFDMDGTLIDTECLYKQVMTQACRELGYEMSEALHRSLIGVPNAESEPVMRADLGEDFPFARYNTRMHDLLEQEMAEAIPLKPGVFELIEALNARQIPIAVATSTSRPDAPDRLARAGILPHLKALVTRSDVTHGKPHPEPFLAAAAALGMDPGACLALEDSFTGVRAAHAAGTQTVMIPDLLQPTDDIRALCQAVMIDLHAVHEAIARVPA